MRLWHQKLIHHLDDRRLLGQHRECCALRGLGWGKKHSVVDYVFTYSLGHLFQYHLLVMHEMIDRNMKPSGKWFCPTYRGKNLPICSLKQIGSYVWEKSNNEDTKIYKEHDDSYLRECLLNLKAKNAVLVNGASIERLLITLDLKEKA